MELNKLSFIINITFKLYYEYLSNLRFILINITFKLSYKHLIFINF